MHVPGLKLAVPSTPADAKALLKSAIRDDDPVVFLEHKLLYSNPGEVPADIEPLAFGRAAVRRPGRHLTIVATHVMLLRALAVADRLAAEGVEVEVIDPRTLVPLDLDTIVQSVRRTSRLLICHEAVTRGGWAGEIAMAAMPHVFDYLDVPIPFSEPLENAVIPSEACMESAIRDLVMGASIAKPARF
jgi:pyruvate dehydrogenase E1 component beta subunit